MTRIGQDMNNFTRWLKNEQGFQDLFYVEDDYITELYKKFINDMQPNYDGADYSKLNRE